MKVLQLALAASTAVAAIIPHSRSVVEEAVRQPLLEVIRVRCADAISRHIDLLVE
jgi:hypothetical protein